MGPGGLWAVTESGRRERDLPRPLPSTARPEGGFLHTRPPRRALGGRKGRRAAARLPAELSGLGAGGRRGAEAVLVAFGHV